MAENPTFKKRERERQRQERQREKERKRHQRRSERPARAPGDEDPDLAGIVPGPQPSAWPDEPPLDPDSGQPRTH